MRTRALTAASALVLAGTIATPAVWAQNWEATDSGPGARRTPIIDRALSNGTLGPSINIGSAAADRPADAASRRERRKRLASRQAGTPEASTGNKMPAAIESDSQSSLVNQQVQKSDYNNVVDSLMYGDDLLADQTAVAEDYVAGCDGYYGYGGGLPAVTGGISVVPPDGLPPLVVTDRTKQSAAEAGTGQE